MEEIEREGMPKMDKRGPSGVKRLVWRMSALLTEMVVLATKGNADS